MGSKNRKPVKCNYCTKTFTRISNRYRHMRSVHKRNQHGENVSLPKFTCVLCEKEYSSKFALQHHTDTVHLNLDKNYKCSSCTFETNHKGNLERHILKIHTNRQKREDKKTISCSKCTAKFTHLATLRVHERNKHNCAFESRIKRKCPLCPYYSTRKSKKEIIEHFSECHALNVKWEVHCFPTVQKFIDWKNQLQIDTSTLFTNRTSNKTSKSLYYFCHRRGFFKTKGFNIRPKKMYGSCKIDAYCPCEITAKIHDNGSVSAMYLPTHVGHKNDPNFVNSQTKSTTNKGSRSLSKTFHGDITAKSRQSHMSVNKLHRIRLSNNKELMNIEKSFDLHFKELRHKFDPISIGTWVYESKSNSNTVLMDYKPQGKLDVTYPQLKEEDFLLIYMTEDQKLLLKCSGQSIVSIYGTHGLNSRNFQLYTLLTLNESREGVPCAFMFTNRGDESILSVFFQSIKSVAGPIVPKVFMSDIEDSSYSAWSKTMGPAELQLFCTSDVLKAWQSNLNKIPNKEKKVTVYKYLKTLLYELDCQAFHKILLEVLNELKNDFETLEYFYYFNEKFIKNNKYKCWAYCYRTDAGINTNMSLENFNRVLKYSHLRGRKIQQLDKTLYVILNSLKENFFDYFIKVEKGNLVSKLQLIRSRHKHALLIPEENVTKDSSKWVVHSTSNDNEFYCIKKVQECSNCQLQCIHCDTCFHEYMCTCTDNSVKNNMCVHIHAVCRTLQKVIQLPVEDSHFEINEEGDINIINIEGDCIIEEIIAPQEDEEICKRELGSLWAQIMESTVTNEEIQFVHETLKKTLSNLDLMKEKTKQPITMNKHEIKHPEKKDQQASCESQIDNRNLPTNFTYEEELALDTLLMDCEEIN